MVCSVYYLGCVVININAPFAEWRITEYDYFQILLFGILSGMEPTIYFHINAVTATFHVLVNTYFLNFRLALLSVLRVLAHLIYLVIFSNFSVFNFPFLISNNIFLFPGYTFSLLIFDVEFHYQLNVFKAPKMVWYNRRSLMISVKDAKYIHLLSHLSYFLELFIL